jgi:MFS family permease
MPDGNRASSFLYLTFGATLGGLIGPLLAGILMTNFGPWVPIYIALIVTPFMLCVFFFIPETLHIETRSKSNHGQTFKAAFKEHIGKGLDDLMHSLDMIKNINVPIVLLTFFFQSARLSAYTSILIQYISKHFGWKLGETSLLLSPLGVLNLIVLLALPKVSEILVSRRFKFTVFGKDLFLTKVSTLLIIVGALIEAFSHNVVLFLFGLFIGTFGAADSPLARATVSHYVDAKSISKLYALIGMVEVSGSFIGGPVLAKLFNIGLERKGIFIGLPWLYIAFLCGLAFIALLFVRPPLGDNVTESEILGREAAGVNESVPEDPLHQQ